jgi:hypothetical protein
VSWTDWVVPLVWAAIGAAAAVWATGWSIRKAATLARSENLQVERTSLHALLIEIAMARQLAERASATKLPTQMLEASVSGIHHMSGAGKTDLVAYSTAVLRYKGACTLGDGFV